jgi:hypothetical protein
MFASVYKDDNKTHTCTYSTAVISIHASLSSLLVRQTWVESLYSSLCNLPTSGISCVIVLCIILIASINVII